MLDQLQAVLNKAREGHKYTSDIDKHGVPDYWDIDLEGDCEDHALWIRQEPTGNMLTDEDGNEYPELAPLPGWHVNIRLLGESRRADVEALDAAHGVTPTAPRRVWL